MFKKKELNVVQFLFLFCSVFQLVAHRQNIQDSYQGEKHPGIFK